MPALRAKGQKRGSCLLLCAAASFACRRGVDEPLLVEIEQIGPSSFVASFTAERETTATAAFWQGSETEPPDNHHFVQDGATASTDHELTILGLRPGRSYTAVVTATDAEGEVSQSETIPIETDNVLPLPSNSSDDFDEVWLSTTVYAPRPDLMLEDRVLVTNLALSLNDQMSMAVVWDRRGYPVWTHHVTDMTSGGTGDVDVTFLEESEQPWLSDNQGRAILLGGGIPTGTYVSEVSLDHQVRAELSEQGIFMGNEGFMHHSARKVEDHWLTINSIDTDHGISDWLVLHDESFDPLVNEDPSEGVVWDLVVKEDLGDFTYFSNTLDYDEESDTYVFYVQMKDVLMGIDAESKQPRWVFGPGVDDREWESEVVVIDQLTDPGGCGDPWFYGAHGLEFFTVEGEGDTERHLLAHDNGIQVSDTAVRSYTRAVEYRIDTEQGSAELLWCYPQDAPTQGDLAPLAYSNRIWGDIERSGDNVFLFSGSPEAEMDGVPSMTAITELHPDYERNEAVLAWRMVVSGHEDNAEGLIPTFYSGHVGMALHGTMGQVEPDFSADEGEEPVSVTFSRLAD